MGEAAFLESLAKLCWGHGFNHARYFKNPAAIVRMATAAAMAPLNTYSGNQRDSRSSLAVSAMSFAISALTSLSVKVVLYVV